MQVLSEPGHIQLVGIALSVIMATATGINVYVGLRLSALQSKMKADSAALEIALMKQFVQWRDDLLQLLNAKYVTGTLASEIHANLGREMARIGEHLDRIEQRCAAVRIACGPSHHPEE